MRCECGNEMVLDVERDSDTNIFIEVYRCPKCGEVELTEEQLRSYRSKVKKPIFKIKSKVNAIKDRFFIEIPNEISKYHEIDKGSEVYLISVDKKKLVIQL